MRARTLTVGPGTVCQLTKRPLLGPAGGGGAFYVFPSGYAYSAAALVAHVLPFLPPHKQKHVRNLCGRLGHPAPPRPPGEASAEAEEAAEALRNGPPLSEAERDALQVSTVSCQLPSRRLPAICRQGLALRQQHPCECAAHWHSR